MTQHKKKTTAHAERHSNWPAIGAVAATALLASAVVVRQRTRAAEAREPPHGKFMLIDGVELHYTDSGGNKPVVVLLHGNGAMIQDFEISGLTSILSRKHRVITFDRPGYGYSTRPHRTWTPEAQADLLHQAVRELGAQSPIVFGHSWGAQVALAMALRYSLHVSGVAVAGGYYFPTARADVVLFSPPAIPVFGSVMRHTLAPLIGEMIAPSAIEKMFAPQPVSPKFQTEFPLGLALRPIQLRASAEEAAMMIPGATRLEKEYSKLTLPLAIIAGAADEIVDPHRQAMKLHRMVPGSELLLLPGLGHMVHHGAPQVVADAIDSLHYGSGKLSQRAPSQLQSVEGAHRQSPDGLVGVEADRAGRRSHE